jgi:hypothetical protein
MNNKRKMKKKKTLHKKRADGVAQGVCPEFKPHYHKEKNREAQMCPICEGGTGSTQYKY